MNIKTEGYLVIILPYPYNVGISVDNVIFCDTNDSAEWDYFSTQLPKPKHEWRILRRSDDGRGNIITLIDKKI